MFANLPIPPSYSLIKKGNVFLLLKEEYKDLLLQLGIDDPEAFIARNCQNSRYMEGRMAHPSILIRDGLRIIARRYLHGGFFRRFNKSLYFWRARSFRELVLTEEVRSCGIPTVQPVGAIHRLILFPLYQAYFLSLEVPHSKDLIGYFQEMSSHPSLATLSDKRALVRAIGHLVRRFHEAGFYHGDLQLKNILVAEGQPLLIDFDRSYRKPNLSAREKIRNLLRLNRSVEKWKHRGLRITRTDRWRFFLAYASDDAAIREAIRKKIGF